MLVLVPLALRRPHHEHPAGNGHHFQDDAVPQVLRMLPRPTDAAGGDLALPVDSQYLEFKLALKLLRRVTLLVVRRPVSTSTCGLFGGRPLTMRNFPCQAGFCLLKVAAERACATLLIRRNDQASSASISGFFLPRIRN